MAFLLETGYFPAFEHKRLMVQDKHGNGDWGKASQLCPQRLFNKTYCLELLSTKSRKIFTGERFETQSP
jgi:hypothetical protein